MNKVEYKIMKKRFITQLGASNDAESLNYFVDEFEKPAKMAKWPMIGLGVLGIPLCLFVIGIPMLIGAIYLYFFIYRKSIKEAQMFREHINSDTELSAVKRPYKKGSQ